MSLVDLATFRAWYRDLPHGPASGNFDDANLQRLLDAADICVFEHCKRRWYDNGVGVDSIRTFWPTWSTGTRLVVGVASSATEVTVDGSALDGDDWDLVDAGGATDAVLLVRKRGRWNPPSYVTLAATYDAGDAGDNVIEAICRIVLRWATSALAPNGQIQLLETGTPVMRSWRDPDVLQLLERDVIDLGR